MLKVLIILGLVGLGAFVAWKKFMATPEEDDLADDLYGPAPTQQAGEGATPA